MLINVTFTNFYKVAKRNLDNVSVSVQKVFKKRLHSASMCFVLLGRGTVDESSCERKNRGQIHHRNGKYIGHPVTPPLPSHRQGPRWTPFVQMERERGGGKGAIATYPMNSEIPTEILPLYPIHPSPTYWVF